MSQDKPNKYYSTPRKVFDKTIDRLENKIGRLKQEIKESHKRLRKIEDFLSASPHAAMWLKWKE